jgi:hypothetical protein
MRTCFWELPLGIAAKRVRVTTVSLLVENRGGRMAIDSTMDGTASVRPGLSRVIIAATIGNVLEIFDFVVYGFFAVTIAEVFFPASNQTVSLLVTFGTFGLGYVVRPLGAVIIGTYADRAEASLPMDGQGCAKNYRRRPGGNSTSHSSAHLILRHALPACPNARSGWPKASLAK